MKKTVVSLFSGGGGLDLGFKNAGYDIIWAIDNNQNAVNTYKANIGHHIKCADITKENIELIPKADVVIGGPPCQSFSLAGMRNVEDARGQLIWQYMRIIEHVKPEAFVFENVTGLLSAKNSKKEKIVDLLKQAFQDIGYSVEMQIMNAADYGVPQRRKRVIIVGLKGDKKFTFPLPTHGTEEPGLKPYVSVFDALDDLPLATNDENTSVEYKNKPLTNYQKRMRKGNGNTVSEHFMPTLSELDKYIISHVKPGGNYMDIPKDVKSQRIQRLQRDGGHTTCYGRMLPSAPSYTINTYFNRPNVGCNIHYSQDRLITVREALRLQSFPDSYRIVSSSKQGRNLIVGNAVPPLLAEVIARKLNEELNDNNMTTTTEGAIGKMVSYSDSEVRVFHPICESALNQAISALRLSGIYEAKHHIYTGNLEMDYVVANKITGKYLCVVEVKRTPSDVQSTRYQIQAQSYVQENQSKSLNEKPFYVITNLEKLISFRYNSLKPSVYQQILQPGLESICDFTVDDETVITSKLASVFQRLLDDFINDRYRELTTLDDFLTCMKAALPNKKQWKSSMAVLMYEYLRGAFHAVRKSSPTITYNVSKFGGNVQQICIEANKVDFDGIFSYDAANYLPRLVLANGLLSDIYNYGEANVSGDAIADALHNMVSEPNKHEGEVATDLELANLVSTAAKMVNGNISTGKIICDPAAGSGNLISSAINVFGVSGSQIMANDINLRLLELLSLRLGLNYPNNIDRKNSPKVTVKDIVNFSPADFANVEVVLLNPPFVAGINCVTRKAPFYSRIRVLKGSNAITEIGQQNLGAVFLELVCHLVPNGTTIACIFPKAHLTERGDEAVAFRQMLLGVFGLQCIFNYSGQGLFENVNEETCILVGKKAGISNSVKVYSSDVPVADIDLHALEQYSGGYNPTDFDYITSDIEAREITVADLLANIADGWRMVCSEMSESIAYIENNIIRNAKIDKITNSTNIYRKGQVGVNGGSDLMFFDSIPALYNAYKTSVILEEGMRNAKCDDFIITNGDSKFLNFNNLGAALSNRIITDYTNCAKPAGQQQRAVKTILEWEKITKKDGSIRFPANSILVPTKIRRNGRIHVSIVPLYVSTNFVVFSYASLQEAQVIASYMSTVFYQLECEVSSKDHAGVRKGEVKDVITTHVPIYNLITQGEINDIIAELSNVTFKDLNNPTITHMDEIWAHILFGVNAKDRLDEAIRLLRFLANRRNPIK